MIEEYWSKANALNDEQYYAGKALRIDNLKQDIESLEKETGDPA
ncbi:hypothetical protein [Neptuniibacter sp. QD37_11]